jgi:hypothetical protein
LTDSFNEQPNPKIRSLSAVFLNSPLTFLRVGCYDKCV